MKQKDQLWILKKQQKRMGCRFLFRRC